ncbi:unnamed protein product [Lymnaea stagnalis]|uniref:UBX domain-containing protein n=1 Tax=Lymnaea stagnalis TaxID=6523 RepID=A0AAV2IJZ0_LYMST
MASESVGLDDIMATLMSMGFEFSDCHEAITNGKLTVQAAIDWILAGKPGNVAATQTTLKLNKTQTQGELAGGTSNPFVQANISALTGTLTMESSTSSEAMGIDIGDDAVVSRSHLSEKQLQIKQSFEEKERLEAKRTASDEKRKKKHERERILKEIQEDREKAKLTKQSKLDLHATQPQINQLPTTLRESPDGQEDVTTTSIQVRLPSGQMYRQSFSVSSTLSDVWDSVYSLLKTAMNAHSGFIQPFPRKEFSREEMRLTLKELGLVPSGSLVLKKKDVQQASPMDPNTVQSPIIMRALDRGVRFRRPEEDADEDEEEDFNAAPGPPQHRWGRGFRVEDAENENRDEPMDVGNKLASNKFPYFTIRNPFDQIRGLAAHPMLGNNQRFEGFGNRLVPEGVPGDNNRHLNRRPLEMAAEAAAQRSTQPHVQEIIEPRASHSEHFYSVRSLQDLAMYMLARRLTDPRIPIFSMSGLSEELLQKFLSYLMKESLLKAKILHLMPSYLFKLVLDFYPYATNELLHAVRMFVNLHTLSLNSCTLITDSGLVSIKGLKALRVLNLSGCSQITNACFPVLQELKNLQTLNLEGTGVTDAGVVQFASTETSAQLLNLDLSRTSVTHEILPSLQNMKKLKSLYLKHTKIMSLAGLDAVTSLENLDISDTHIVTDSVLCLTRLPCLHQISLTGTQDVQGDKALYYLKDMKLTTLFLPSRTTTTDTGMGYITGFHLSALDLTNYTNVGDSGMMHIGKIVSLKKLVLTNTKISDEGMQHLSGLVNLEVLFLDRTLVSNAGAAVVVYFKNLNELSLSATSVTSDLLKQGSLNQCINLTKLNLSRTIIGDKGIVNLRLPNLLMLNLDCTRVHPQSVDIIETNCPNVKSVTIANLASLMEDEEN